MRKIINGRMYDTETAKEICSWSNGYYTDFKYIEETLYQKSTGEFFIHGEGGAASAYSKSCGSNSMCGGQSIIPVSESLAKDFVERHGSVEDYENLFGKVDE